MVCMLWLDVSPATLFTVLFALTNCPAYPDKIRYRISQVLILPPYQRQGHGRRLYDLIYNQCLARPDVRQVTVEDPNDEFQTLRDLADVARLREAMQSLQAPVDPSVIDDLVRDFKLDKVLSINDLLVRGKFDGASRLSCLKTWITKMRHEYVRTACL